MDVGMSMMSKANETVRSKLESALNNVRYKASFKSDGPIWLLGRMYRGTKDFLEANYHDFIVDFTSRFWFTYRDGFTPLPDHGNMKSDCGWGCMLRSGQMILAQALVLHLLGRDWNMFRQPQVPVECYWHNRILWLFNDVPVAPFSIHRFVEAGRSLGKLSGDWFGPASTAHIIKKLFFQIQSDATLSMSELSSLAIYVAADCTVCLEDVEKLCSTAHEASPSPCSSLTSNEFTNFVNHVPSGSGIRMGSNVVGISSILNSDNIDGCGTGRVRPIERQDHLDSWVDIDKGECCEMSILDCPVSSDDLVDPRIIRSSMPEDFEALYCHEVEDFDEFQVFDEVLQPAQAASNGASSSNNNNNTPKQRQHLYPNLNFDMHEFSTGAVAGQWLKSVIILIPLRLGSEHLNPIYIESLKNLLSLDYCLGIIGGKPKRSMYFIGFHGDKVLYLDPHFCQDAVSSTNGTLQSKTFHCTWPKLIAFKDMDPSCAIGFYIRNRQQLQKFRHDIENVNYQNRKTPLFTIVERRDSSCTAPQSSSSITTNQMNIHSRNGFVFL